MEPEILETLASTLVPPSGFAVPGFVVPDGHLFGYPTRFVETWTPRVEHVLLKGYTVDSSRFSVAKKRGDSLDLWQHIHPRLRRIDWRAKNRIRIVLDKVLHTPSHAGGALVYDGRWILSDNMCHILCEVAPRALYAKKVLEASNDRRPIRVILPAKLAGWAKRSFELLGLDVICTNGRVHGEQLTIECEQITGCFPRIYDQPFQGHTTDTPSRVFISRRQSRTLINEEQVWQYLRSLGFQRFYFEDIPVELQWSIMKNASDIIAIHGAAMGAMVFNRRGLCPGHADGPPRLLELINPGWVSDGFRGYTAALGIRWAGVRGQITPEILRDLDFKKRLLRHEATPFRISLESLDQAMSHLSMDGKSS
jgi:hypothetical protein